MDLNQEYSKYKEEIESKLSEFSRLDSTEYPKELFFCLLTPQSNAEKCWQAVQQLEKCKLNENEVQECLKTKTRFYRNKTRYILEASEKWPEIKRILENNNPLTMREKIVKNIKGLGLKEASHFLRNIGKSKNQLAILDRHILRKMRELNLIQEINIKNSKDYLEKEGVLKEFAKKVSIPLDHLDLLFWKIESGRIFK